MGTLVFAGAAEAAVVNRFKEQFKNSLSMVDKEKLEEQCWEFIFTNNLSVGEAQELHRWVDSL